MIWNPARAIRNGVDDVLVGVVERDGKAFLEAVFAPDYDDLSILKSFIRRDHTLEVSLDDATADRPASYRQDCGRVVIEPRELAHRSGSAKRVEAPIDAERFLAGLLLRYSETSDQSRELDAWNTARAISQGGFGDDLGWLQKMAEDDDLDGFNRLQATQVLYYLSDEELGEVSEEAARIIEGLDATQVSREWMAIMASLQDLNDY